MFISDLSIRRPVVATVMMLTLVTLGLFSWRRLSIDLMPDVEIPVLSITTESVSYTHLTLPTILRV